MDEQTLSVPAPTQWPLVLAFGVALSFAGLATSAAVTVVGALAVLFGCIGWARQVLPREALEEVPARTPPPPAVTMRKQVVHLQAVHGSRRAWLPLEIYPASAGIRGGLAGGFAMALVAILYGLFTRHGVWYPINLLAAGFFPSAVTLTPAEGGRFYADAFALACGIHLLGSVLVGLLYGAMLPMLPRHPILLAGVAAPLLWTALLRGTIGIINPVLGEHLDWPWFVTSQFAFGIVAGTVVSTRERLRTWQNAPFAVRAGVEGTEDEP